MKKDLVIGAVAGLAWKDIETWALSLANCCYQGIGAMIVYDDNEEVMENLKTIGFQVLPIKLKGSVYNQRFYDFHASIKNSLDSLRYVIITDARDIYFQSNPVEWLENNLTKPFIASSEAIRYRDEEWNLGNLNDSFPEFKSRLIDKCVYNVGVLAGEARYISDLCLSISLMTKASGFNVSDQTAFNLLLDMQPYMSSVQIVSSEAGFACQAGTMADPSKIDKFRPKLLEPEPILTANGVTTNSGKLYPIVHQYDRVPEWKKYFANDLSKKMVQNNT